MNCVLYMLFIFEFDSAILVYNMIWFSFFKFVDDFWQLINVYLCVNDVVYLFILLYMCW